MSAPALRRGVRLDHDHVRDRPVVLYPEGVLMPNRTATAVLELCDGRTTVDGIAERLRERFSGVREQEVREVLERLVERRVVEWT
ncbi:MULTISPECIES: pyrroloquinoline quinone biosynthesis peptide chaperone PqqD [Saccharopolyspora]|uniref:Pyrroloquinoline quinone biosynthesis peptide chaperone PqqD n=1 Tax=Saccharopolyspora cebuensis TaxID=418759 RepID=A0ABV4CQ28_9PSEU